LSLDVAAGQAYAWIAAETKAAGIGLLKWSGKEPLCNYKRLFCRLGGPAMRRSAVEGSVDPALLLVLDGIHWLRN
jgi:hypothetical protein